MILASTWGLLRDAVQLSLDTVPPNINAAQVRSCLEELPGVAGLHDLHIWPLSTTETALTAHLVLPKGNPGDSFLLEATNRLRERFGIGHVTLQIETGPESGCALASSTAV